MKMIVCTKQVPASESRIKVAASGKEADSDELTYVVNPYDEFGVEEAIRIRERLGAGEVTVISVGPSKAAEALRTSLAMGADKAILLSDPVFSGSDSLGIARILAAQIRTMEYDLIFFGKQAIDDDMGAVGIMVAELLSLPHVGMINKLEISADKKSAVAQRQIEGAHEIMELPLPAVFTCQKGLNEPRYPSLPGIMKAKSKPLAEIGNSQLKVNSSAIGEAGSRVRVMKMAPPPARSGGKILDGSPAEAAQKLAKLLREEAKVI